MSEVLEECPYNSAHKFHAKRRIPHLLKCKKLYPDVEIRECPLNRAHIVRAEKYLEHLKNCPDKKVISSYMVGCDYKEEDKIVQAEIETEENWDDENVIDFDPEKLAETKTTLRQPVGLPAERKAILKREAEEFVANTQKDSVKDEISDDILNVPVIKKEKRTEIKFNRIKSRERMTRNDLEIDNKVAIPTRPITPPPPCGIDWSASSSRRDRSRSPLDI